MEREFDLDVSWWPFELHPEIPPGGVAVADLVPGTRLSNDYRLQLREYAAASGINLASRSVVANSHRALELGEFARDRGRFAAVHEALFRVYFEEGRDIGDEAVLEDVAREAALDVEAWRLESVIGRYRELVDRSTAVAREKGFMSTPTMIFDDRFMMTGAQDEYVYRDVLRRMGAAPREPAADGEA